MERRVIKLAQPLKGRIEVATEPRIRCAMKRLCDHCNIGGKTGCGDGPVFDANFLLDKGYFKKT
jgi:NAD(P)H-flavin reductase